MNGLSRSIAPARGLFRLPPEARPVILASVRKDGLLLFAATQYDREHVTFVSKYISPHQGTPAFAGAGLVHGASPEFIPWLLTKVTCSQYDLVPGANPHWCLSGWSIATLSSYSVNDCKSTGDRGDLFFSITDYNLGLFSQEQVGSMRSVIPFGYPYISEE